MITYIQIGQEILCLTNTRKQVLERLICVPWYYRVMIRPGGSAQRFNLAL